MTDLKDKVKDKLPHKEHNQGQASNVADLAKGKINEISESISEYKNSFDSRVSDFKEELNAKIPNQDDLESLRSRMPDVKGKLETMRTKAENLDPLTYMAIGAGLGAMTGASLPISEMEESFVEENLQNRLSTFNEDLHHAINDCSNILKDLVLQDVKNISLKLF
jgi:gas vesicle protein